MTSDPANIILSQAKAKYDRAQKIKQINSQDYRSEAYDDELCQIFAFFLDSYVLTTETMMSSPIAIQYIDRILSELRPLSATEILIRARESFKADSQLKGWTDFCDSGINHFNFISNMPITSSFQIEVATLLWWGMKYEHDRGQFEKAIEFYDMAAKRDPNNFHAWYKRGTCLTSLQNFAEAIPSFNRAIAINPRDYFAWNDKAFSHMVLGNYDEAIRSADMAIRIDPSIFNCWVIKAQSLERIGRHQEAVVCANRARQLGYTNRIL